MRGVFSGKSRSASGGNTFDEGLGTTPTSKPVLNVVGLTPERGGWWPGILGRLRSALGEREGARMSAEKRHEIVSPQCPHWRTSHFME